jgi:hypothetical protein
MEEETSKNEKLLAKYSKLVEVKTGGIFTAKTRKRMLGVSGPGRKRLDTDRSKYDLWYDVRKNVEIALKDLKFFIEAAGDANVNQVITRDALEPIVRELLWDSSIDIPPFPDRAKLYLERARIADLFIKWGFDYLSEMNSNMMPLPLKKTMEEAIALSQFLLATFKAGSE